MTPKDQQKYDKLMAIKGMTEAEALDIIRCDHKIDADEPLFTLPDDAKRKKQNEAIDPDEKKAKRKPIDKKPSNKSEVIQILDKTLQNAPDLSDIMVTDAEKEIIFTYKGEKYGITLLKKRG